MRPFALVFALLLAGCFSGNGVHVSYGTRPEVIDDDVRFRTTYYFRTFDYCWAANVVAARTVGPNPVAIDYRKIIPETDTLYRYRMTGKASALFSNVRFGSGTLTAAEIDPFGADVGYSDGAKGFVFRTRSEVKDADTAARRRAEVAADREAALERYKALIKITPDAADAAAMTAARTAALNDYVGTVATTRSVPSLDVKTNELLATLGAQVGANAAEFKQLATDLRAAIEMYKAKANEKPTLVEGCPVGDRIAKGFQIMGPEGIRTFRQDERLLLAMSSSAEPLIETLQEFSKRVSNPKVNAAEQLLPIVRESVRTEAARRAAAEAALGVDPLAPFVQARTAFEIKP